MNNAKIYTAIGLMSGTSLDGIDAALIKTNGTDIVEFGPSLTVPYDDSLGGQLRGCLGNKTRDTNVERELTLRHEHAVNALLSKAGLSNTAIDVVGFHGHTVHHDPANAMTLQLGDGALLANRLGIAVVSELRSQDVALGGQGAPLVPIYHAALVQNHNQLDTPVAIVNIGGVANVTWVGPGVGPGVGPEFGPQGVEPDQDNLLAFDTGPGNAPLNDWVQRHTGQSMDTNGEIAAAGAVNQGVLAKLMDHAYFDLIPPKSLDRQDFQASACDGLSLEEGAATLTAFTAQSIAKAAAFFPTPVSTWIICGGGRLNPTLMNTLQTELEACVISADTLGWDGDALEAQAFAYLAVRNLQNLPITFPKTTGATCPSPGGTLHPA